MSSLNVASQDPASSQSQESKDQGSNRESIARSFQLALSILSPNSSVTTQEANAPYETVTSSPAEAIPRTTDVYSRALKYLEDRQKKQKRRLLVNPSSNRTNSRPRINHVRAREQSSRIQDASALNITKRKDDLVSDQEIDNLTDAMANLTLENGSGRAESGRSYDGFSSIFSKFTKVLDLGRVVREIETSVMTSVSCTACRAGNYYVCLLNN